MNLMHHYGRLHDFIEERIREDIYPELPSKLHSDITEKMVQRLSSFVNLRGAKVLDCGCGQGVALEQFENLGANSVGTTFGEDCRVCREKGFEVYEMDQSFLDFPQNTFDVLWCRHALEHSLFPLFTLRGFRDVLKPEGIMYLEMPAPDTACMHETNQNHYSCFTKNAWISLIERSGFKIFDYNDIEFNVPAGPDRYYSFFCKKR